MSDLFQQISLPRRPLRQEADIEAEQARRDLAVIGQGQNLLGDLIGTAGRIWQGISTRNAQREDTLRRAASAGQRIEAETALRVGLAESRSRWGADDWDVSTSLQEAEGLVAQGAESVLDPEEQVRFKATAGRLLGSYVEGAYGRSEQDTLRRTEVAFIQALDDAEATGDAESIREIGQQMVDARVADPDIMSPGGFLDFRAAKAQVNNITESQGLEAAQQFVLNDRDLARSLSRQQRAELLGVVEARMEEDTIAQREAQLDLQNDQMAALYDDFTSQGLLPAKGSLPQLLSAFPAETWVALEEKYDRERTRRAREAETGEERPGDAREAINERLVAEFMGKWADVERYRDQRALMEEAFTLYAQGSMPESLFSEVRRMDKEHRGQLRQVRAGVCPAGHDGHHARPIRRQG